VAAREPCGAGTARDAQGGLASAEALDDRDELVALVALLAREAHELARG
jgi:hypothetical protein